jgi:hypothetical protein
VRRSTGSGYQAIAAISLLTAGVLGLHWAVSDALHRGQGGGEGGGKGGVGKTKWSGTATVSNNVRLEDERNLWQLPRSNYQVVNHSPPPASHFEGANAHP